MEIHHVVCNVDETHVVSVIEQSYVVYDIQQSLLVSGEDHSHADSDVE